MKEAVSDLIDDRAGDTIRLEEVGIKLGKTLNVSGGWHVAMIVGGDPQLLPTPRARSSDFWRPHWSRTVERGLQGRKGDSQMAVGLYQQSGSSCATAPSLKASS